MNLSASKRDVWRKRAKLAETHKKRNRKNLPPYYFSTGSNRSTTTTTTTSVCVGPSLPSSTSTLVNGGARFGPLSLCPPYSIHTDHTNDGDAKQSRPPISRIYPHTLGFITLPRAPRLISSDMTVPSRSGSMGGFVT